MATVETVNGPIDAGELGETLIHEHLRCMDEAVAAQWPDRVTLREEAPHAVEAGGERDEAVKMAKQALERGVKTIVDPTAMFLGRDVSFMKSVAGETGLQVVPCTGIYTYDHLPQFFLTRSPEQIAEMFVADIEKGIQGTGIKAAFIKCAADEPGLTENITKIHRAAAMASNQTGAPIMAHSHAATKTATKQLDLFEEENVDLSKVQVAHAGDSDDADYVESIVSRGAYAGLDRFGLELYMAYETRIDVAMTLLDKGLEDRLFLSADSCATIDWFPPEILPALIESGQAIDWDVRITHDRVIPSLVERGMTDEQRDQMMVTNAANWLTGA